MPISTDDVIVFVAPTAQRPHDGYAPLMSKFDKAKIISNRILLITLKRIFKKVYYYKSVPDFINNISNHKEHVIFPYYYGVGSRINPAFIQSVCESYGLRYIGPESYALIVCNDKLLAKDICRNNNIATPKAVAIYSADDEVSLEHLNELTIVKPVFEGNSIGISKDSLCEGADEALAKARALYQKISAPVMIEEFLSGDEVNVCIMGDHCGRPTINTIVIEKKYDVFDYNHKHNSFSFHKYHPFKSEIIDQHEENFIKLFNMLGKVEFMRIDCILKDKQLLCIELTPDAEISMGSALYRSIPTKPSYMDFINLIIQNSLQYYRNL